jgi:hypothetical protein
LLVPSLHDDPDQKVAWGGAHAVRLSGGRAIAEHECGVIYLAIGLRNVGAGLGLLHGWYPTPGWVHASDPRAELDAFLTLVLDLYIPSGGAGSWESALRDESDPLHGEFVRVLTERRPFRIDLLYGDQDGGQRTISRGLVLPASDGGWYSRIARHFNVDRADPR